jgi:hypothetical protein
MKKILIVLLTYFVAGLALNAQAAGTGIDSHGGPICSMPPVFTGVAVAPQEISAQSDRDVEIIIAGIVTVPDGCGVKAFYTLESSTGLLKGNLTLAADGSFYEKFITSVAGNDPGRDGRVYNGTLFAVDADGDKTSVDYTVTVLHDNKMQIVQK